MMSCRWCGLEWPAELGSRCPWCTPAREPSSCAWGCAIAFFVACGLLFAAGAALERQYDPARTFKPVGPAVQPGR